MHVKEFTEFGIEFDFPINIDISEEDFNSLIDRFISDFVEGNGLFCGGGWNPKGKSAGFIIEIGSKRVNFNYYADKLNNWFESEGIIPPAKYKIVDLWNDNDF